MRGFFNMVALALMLKNPFGGGYSSDEKYKPPPPKKISRKTAVKLSNRKQPGRK